MRVSKKVGAMTPTLQNAILQPLGPKVGIAKDVEPQGYCRGPQCVRVAGTW